MQANELIDMPLVSRIHFNQITHTAHCGNGFNGHQPSRPTVCHWVRCSHLKQRHCRKYVNVCYPQSCLSVYTKKKRLPVYPFFTLELLQHLCVLVFSSCIISALYLYTPACVIFYAQVHQVTSTHSWIQILVDCCTENYTISMVCWCTCLLDYSCPYFHAIRTKRDSNGWK